MVVFREAAGSRAAGSEVGVAALSNRVRLAHRAAPLAGDADYFEPVLEWLRQENSGRSHTLP